MELDRAAVCKRPPGPPLMRQQWEKLLFMHWSLPFDLLRPLVPPQLEIDSFDGQAWIGLVPFTIRGLRPALTPPLPGTSSFHETNVRTYVQLRGVPGVWFFSLDAASRLAVWAAREFFHLPYHFARISFTQEGDEIAYDLRRNGEQRRVSRENASLQLRWRVGAALPEAVPGSLAYFLTERYCLYAQQGRHLNRQRIFHRAWPLHEADLLGYRSTLLEAVGIAQPATPPLCHYAEHLSVEIWPAQRVL